MLQRVTESVVDSLNIERGDVAFGLGAQTVRQTASHVLVVVVAAHLLLGDVFEEL